ncbi:MAG: hypothetical protein KAR39_03060 [Thermoplasmata archaeon]|jgi:hypothetical protein|nr:hypothetical protein [Thermoplasmata archaeon]
MAKKRQVCFMIDEDDAQAMEEIRKETGLPVSRQIEMKLKGYKIVKE